MNSRLELRTLVVLEGCWWRFRFLAASAKISCRGDFFSCREKKFSCRAVDNSLPWKIFFVP
jgi:hypothetical protein